jgi:dienelactone hydrolase
MFDTNSITPNFLVVYFHSHGGNYKEPFDPLYGTNASIAKALFKDIPGVAVQSIDRDSAAVVNGSDGYRGVSELISQRMAERSSFKHIILCGTSLGAYEALAYLHYAPESIFEKISGVISVEPTDDLVDLYWKTRSSGVKDLLRSAFDYYRAHSIRTLFTNIADRPDVKVFVVSAKRDRVIPPGQQKRLCATLRQKQFKVAMVEIDGVHGIAPPKIYGDALHFVTGR